jgi:DNA-binding LacI/PurR family transcriptional regulator
VLAGDETEAAGSAAAATLLADERRLPTAVAAFNDRSALGLLDAFLRAGLAVPSDISVVGYDDSHLAKLAHVGLTSVSQEARRQAQEVVAAAVDRLEAPSAEQRHVVLSPRLVVRRTTGPPPTGGPTDGGLPATGPRTVGRSSG